MTRQNLSTGTTANDGTGDTLRSAAIKINANFVELYKTFGGDSDIIAQNVLFDSTGILFGDSADADQLKLTIAPLSANRIATLPDVTGEVVIDVATQTLTNKTLTSPVMTTPQINDTSADHQYIFAVSELAADRTITLPLLSGDDEVTFNQHTQTLTNKTLSTPVLNSPTIATKISDTNGAELMLVTATASAINEITIANAATGAAPSLTASGGDGNVNLNLSSKGSGAVNVNKLSYTQVVQTADGVVSNTASFVMFNKATALSATLANGGTTGEIKYLANQNTGLVTVIPFSFAQGSSFSIAQNGATQIIWGGANWYIVGGADSANTYISIT